MEPLFLPSLLQEVDAKLFWLQKEPHPLGVKELYRVYITTRRMGQKQQEEDNERLSTPTAEQEKFRGNKKAKQNL